MTDDAATRYRSRSFDFGRAFTHTFTAVWRNAPVLLALSACIWLISFVLGTAVRAVMGVPNFLPGRSAEIAAVGGGVLSLMLILVELAFLSAVVNYVVGRVSADQQSSFGDRFTDCVGVGIRKGLPIVGLYIVQIIPIYIGMAFLVVPGVILSMIWFVTAPALVNEDIGVFAPFSRSAELTRDNRWVLFGFSLVAGLLMSVVSYAILALGIMLFAGLGMAGGPGASAPPGATLGPMAVIVGLVGSAIFTLVMCFGLSISASAYNELRRIKEGGQDLAKVFS